MKKEILMVLCLFFSISSNLIVIKAEDNTEPYVEISFNLIDNNTGLNLDSAELFVIEGWTGVVFEQRVIQPDDTVFI